jgi:SAM-dependent methyltransferase
MTKQLNAHTTNNPKYKDQNFIDKYVMLWAYGYQNGLGAAEGLYRTINELGFSSLESNGNWHILDVGCGVGRTAAD